MVQKIENINHVLSINDTSFLIHKKRINTNIIIGVPHHAFYGTEHLPTKDNRSADENAGFLGNYIASQLKCTTLIASNYSFDVNKIKRSDYFQFILKNRPKLLIEIHGHRGTNTHYDVEISSGNSKRSKFSREFADLINKSCQQDPELNHLRISGDFNKIYYKATKSKSIVDSRWLALHLELPLELRKEKINENFLPPKKGFRFCDYCVNAVINMFNSLIP